MFGWGNGKYKHLSKYSEIFERKYYAKICVTTSLKNSVFRTNTAGLKESLNVRRALEEMLKDNPETPVFLYAFSNGGLSIMYMMINDMDSESFPGRNIKAMIFDSCPIIPNFATAETAQKYYTEHMRNPVLKFLLSGLVKMAIYLNIKTNKKVKKIMTDMEQSSIDSPQLFIFSKDDELAPYQDILDFIEARENIGIQVTYKLWNTSIHVYRMKMHTEEYMEEVENFVDECLTTDVKIHAENEKLKNVDDCPKCDIQIHIQRNGKDVEIATEE